MQSLFKYVSQRFCQFLQIFSLFFEIICQICVNSLEFQFFISLLQMCDESRIDIMFQNYCIHTLFFEHINVLALLNLISHIEDCSLFFLFFTVVFLFCCLFCSFLYLLRLFLLVCLNTVFQSQILVVQILKENIIIHLICKFAVFDAAKFDKWVDIIPIFFIIFSCCLTHTSELVCNFLADIIRNLLYKSIILQRASGYVQRQIRTVDHTF